MEKTDPKLIDQIAKLERQLRALTTRVTTLEAENKRLRSHVIRTDMNVGSLTQLVRRG